MYTLIVSRLKNILYHKTKPDTGTTTTTKTPLGDTTHAPSILPKTAPGEAVCGVAFPPKPSPGTSAHPRAFSVVELLNLIKEYLQLEL